MRKYAFVLLAILLATLGFAQDQKLRFVVISHMNASDPNML